MAAILQGGTHDLTDQIPNYAVTNITTDRALDCNGEAGALAVADTLATLIKILIQSGVINGTIA